jgi:hypothetical protein
VTELLADLCRCGHHRVEVTGFPNNIIANSELTLRDPLHRRYDPSAHIDRHIETGSFPGDYVGAMVSRASAVARGTGFKEKYEDGKNRGAKHIFSPIRRPRILDVR